MKYTVTYWMFGVMQELTMPAERVATFVATLVENEVPRIEVAKAE